MRIVCGGPDFDFCDGKSDVNVVLFGKSKAPGFGSVGDALKKTFVRQRLLPSARAWDLLTLALAVQVADLAGHRKRSPDGWTRDLDVVVSVHEPEFWAKRVTLLQELLGFLTTDRWTLTFKAGLELPTLRKGKDAESPSERSIVLLSGGLDSYVGAIDLAAAGNSPLAVSQMVRGDGDNQVAFAAAINGGLHHVCLNHNARVPNQENPPTQRARSIIFLAYGVALATTLKRYQAGDEVPLYVCENGLIAVNPPLTSGRLGSLSTRTTHPVVLALFQRLLDLCGLRVRVVNPYRHKTKGEMLLECGDQALLTPNASLTTSCGRYKRFKYQHCGRCVPCIVRRAAFHKWGTKDKTSYVFENLGKNDPDHSGFDDVRAALIGIAECREEGINRWLGASLSSGLIQERSELVQVVDRGLLEIKDFLKSFGLR